MLGREAEEDTSYFSYLGSICERYRHTRQSLTSESQIQKIWKSRDMTSSNCESLTHVSKRPLRIRNWEDFKGRAQESTIMFLLCTVDTCILLSATLSPKLLFTVY